MGRIVVIDKTIIDQINYGNGDAARAVLGLLRGKAELWITAEARAQLFREAESRLMTDLGVRSPLQDVNSDHDYEKKLHPGGDGSRSVPNKSAKSATLALSKGAEVLTADRVFANTYRGIGGKVAAESGNITALPEVKPFDMNYNVGRRLLGLRDLNLGPNGRILCRWCNLETPTGRVTFCSDWCVHEWRLRSDPGYLREQVLKRDRGVCAICRIDTRAA